MEANALVRLGDACQAGGAHPDADQAWRRALEIFEQLDHPMAADVRAGPTRLAPTGSYAPG